MPLHCILPYKAIVNHQAVSYDPGDVVEGDDAFLAHLLRDAPGCFSETAPSARMVKAAQNRMQEDAANRTADEPYVATVDNAPISKKNIERSRKRGG